ncbi:hypothetical protein DFH08DRAFT_976314 [Mycena albidolilacea]|uniref:Uncharacterized protein n=1 Tax=Mycena albidolilacea TaxID=1033008 RepID=A0AAD6Z3Y8_9AGAR|nr:hypothetical protein DFH08DRAFT_976314 [Mycena albidolilacea]
MSILTVYVVPPNARALPPTGTSGTEAPSNLSKFASVPALPGLASSSSASPHPPMCPFLLTFTTLFLASPAPLLLSTAFLENHTSTTLFLASPAPLLLSTAFLENHDKMCFPSLTMDGTLRKNAMVELFVGDGILT